MRILLYVLMQIAVLVVVSIVGSIILSLFGISLSGSSYTGLLVMCAIFGCVGSLISLFMSKSMCKKAFGVRTLVSPTNEREAFLMQTVSELAQRSGLNMPEVGIYESNDLNAFATGHNRNAALVAVSSALLYNHFISILSIRDLYSCFGSFLSATIIGIFFILFLKNNTL